MTTPGIQHFTTDLNGASKNAVCEFVVMFMFRWHPTLLFCRRRRSKSGGTQLSSNIHNYYFELSSVCTRKVITAKAVLVIMDQGLLS